MAIAEFRIIPLPRPLDTDRTPECAACRHCWLGPWKAYGSQLRDLHDRVPSALYSCRREIPAGWFVQLPGGVAFGGKSIINWTATVENDAHRSQLVYIIIAVTTWYYPNADETATNSVASTGVASATAAAKMMARTLVPA